MADIKQQTYTTHKQFSLSTISQLGYSRNGYDFIKWKDQINGVEMSDGESVTFSRENTYLSAIWNPHQYTITYLDDGTYEEGKENPTSYNIETDDIILNSPSRSNYEFIEWKSDNETIVTIPKGSFGDKTISATWKLITQEYFVESIPSYEASFSNISSLNDGDIWWNDTGTEGSLLLYKDFSEASS